MNKLKYRTTRIHLTPGPIFHERAFIVEIADNGAGEFLVISNDTQHLTIDPDDWPDLREAIDLMVKNVRTES